MKTQRSDVTEDHRPLAVITGASGGIGQKLLPRLAARGYRLVLIDHDASALEEVSDGLDRPIMIVADLLQEKGVQTVTKQIRQELQNVELVVLNAGIIVPKEVKDIAEKEQTDQVQLMLNAPMSIINAALPKLIARGRGHIIATVSMGGIIPMPGSAAYSAAKAGLRAYLAALNAEVRGTGVLVSGVYPSAVDTPMLEYEARNGGSFLNFIGKVFPPERVVDRYFRALETGKLENYLPYGDSVTTRFVSAFPWMLPLLLPLFERKGEKGRQQHINRKDAERRQKSSKISQR